MMDRLVALDTRIKTWLTAEYAPVVRDDDGTEAAVYAVKSRRDMASMEALDADAAQTHEDTERLRLPRVSFQRLGLSPDPSRQRPAVIRHTIGYAGSGERAFRVAPLPVPVNIEYQLDFWTDKASAMTRWELKFARDFQNQVHTLTMVVDDFFRTKYLSLKADDNLTDNSDLEPGEDRTKIRKTARVTAQTWIFPTEEDMRIVPSIRQIVLDIYGYTEDDPKEVFIEHTELDA